MPCKPNVPQQKVLETSKSAMHTNTVAVLLPQGLHLHQQGKFQEAQAIYEQALAIQPDNFDALQLLFVLSAQTKQFIKAIDYLTKALQINPHHAESHNNLGFVLQELQRFNEALASYDQAISIKTDYAEAYNNRGIVLKQLQRLDEALVSYDQAVSIKTDYAGAYNNRGNTLKELQRLDEALTSYDKAISIKADFAEAHSNRGNVLSELKRFVEALASYDEATAIKPDYADAHNNRSIVLQELKRLDEALASYDKAISIKADYAEAYCNRGNALNELQHFDEAIASYDKAISIKADYAEAYFNRGNTLQELKRLDEAIVSYDRAISIKPDYDYLMGRLLHSKMKMCSWTDLVASQDTIIQQIIANGKSSSPFPILSLSADPKIAQQCAQIFVNDKYPTNLALGPLPKRTRGKKIRLGYFSTDFGDHPVSYLTAELFEEHNREQFELFAFSLKNRNQNPFVNRIKNSFDQFIDVTNKSDQEVAQMARELKIDIAVDLGGFTSDSRTGIFAYRAAPIQLSYAGYLGTMGAPYFDYLIADKTIIPPELQIHYSEKIIYLPSYQVNDRKRAISDKKFSRTELCLPETGFVFACFNNNYKILPTTFDGWMRILRKVDGSVLFLFADNLWAEANLKKEAQAKGIDPKRLIFGKHMPRDLYLARYRSCDLFLDTTPYNAGTTASDALWAGLPVLNLIGESFAARVAASLLNAIDLPELITHTQEEYEALAIELATNPQKLAAIQHKLMVNRLTSLLFNTPLFTKHIEAAFSQIMERYWVDLPPAQIEIK